MDAAIVSDVLMDALGVAIKLSAPMLILGLAVGVIIAIFQAVTQIHEQSIGFIFKILVVIVVVVVRIVRKRRPKMPGLKKKKADDKADET